MSDDSAVSVMLAPLRRRNHVLPFVVLLSWTWLAFVTTPYLSIILVVVGGLHFYIELMTQFAFRAPTRRKPPIEHEDWISTPFKTGHHHIQSYVRLGRPDAPTAWICHGWTSGAQRMLGRAEVFVRDGWNVVMFDLPSHGGSSRLTKWTAEHSTTLLISAANQLAKQRPELFSNRLLFYGHSMGSFIGLRLSRRRNELEFDSFVSEWVFESPMTGYSEIFRETCNILRIPLILRPFVLANTLLHVNAIIGPSRFIGGLEDVDVPAWGMPDEPTLIIQANPDERLGISHFERLKQAILDEDKEGLLEDYLVDGLTHNGANTHAERDRIVSGWVKRRATYSSD